MNFIETKETILTDGYKYIELWTGNERKVARNNVGKIEEKLNEIAIELKNNPPGIYEIKAFNSTVKGIRPTIFTVDTRTNKSEPIERKTYVEPLSDKLLENQKVLDLTVKVKELEIENRYLREQITDLENEIAELEAQAAVAPELGEQTPAPSLLESAQNFLGTLMEFGAPLLDQHFALKQQQIELERMKYGQRRPAATPQKAENTENVKIRKIGAWVETFQDQPEIYEALHKISAESETVDQFLTYLNQFNADLYEQLSKQI
jgi:predicted transcriptional regulator